MQRHHASWKLYFTIGTLTHISCNCQYCFFHFQLNVFMPFFVQLVLPYSVVRGELIVLQVNIHNYLPTSEWVRLIYDTTLPQISIHGYVHFLQIETICKFCLLMRSMLRFIGQIKIYRSNLKFHLIVNTRILDGCHSIVSWQVYCVLRHFQ